MNNGIAFNQLRGNLMKSDPERYFKLELIGRLIGLREKKGFSQSELARLSGVPQKTISRMENLKSQPSIGTFYKLADAMDYNMKVVFEEKNGMPKSK